MALTKTEYIMAMSLTNLPLTKIDNYPKERCYPRNVYLLPNVERKQGIEVDHEIEIRYWYDDEKIVVTGRIPLVVLDAIYHEFHGGLYAHGIKDFFSNLKSDDCATSDEMQALLLKAVLENPFLENGENYSEYRDRLFQQFRADNYDTLYVDGEYTIQTKETLLVFLAEYASYLHLNQLNLEVLSDMSNDNLPALIAKVNQMLIDMVNPYQTTEEWLKLNAPSILMRSSGSLSDSERTISELLRRFDVAVNPFSNSDNMVPSIEYANKLLLSGDKKEGSNCLKIKSLDGLNSTTYSRYDDDVPFKHSELNYEFDYQDHIEEYKAGSCYHYYRGGQEFIEIREKRGPWIKYNLTLMAKLSDDQLVSMTLADKRELISKLEDIVPMVEALTVANMCKPIAPVSDLKTIGVDPRTE